MNEGKIKDSVSEEEPIAIVYIIIQKLKSKGRNRVGVTDKKMETV